jgi:hypothetical protein
MFNVGRLASNSVAFGNILGIKNSVHRQKLAVKAMDLVMFGPPKGKTLILYLFHFAMYFYGYILC